MESNPTKDERKRFERLKRSALRLLDTGPMVGVDADVIMPYNRPNVVLSYVSALENLLTDGKEGPIDLRRRTSQRAAILIGINDAARLAVQDVVYSAYAVRNKIAHGDELDSLQLRTASEDMRKVLRTALIAGVALGPVDDLGTLCDRALLSHSILDDKIREPLKSVLS